MLLFLEFSCMLKYLGIKGHVNNVLSNIQIAERETEIEDDKVKTG